MRILIVDDDEDLSMIMKDMYEDYGYEVTWASDCQKAYTLLEKNVYDMILLDINLPETTGFEICREIRKVSSVPIIFASARTSEDDRLKGLDIGGDDYLAKPYSLKELLARTRALLRRSNGFSGEGKVYEVSAGNHLVINTETRVVTKNGQEVNLSFKEFELLKYMAEHMGKTVKKETLLSEVWGMYSEVEASTLTVHIRWLREKLEEKPSKPEYIKTVWGIGYMFGGEDAGTKK